jgi:Glycosyltransferase family 87
LPTFAVPSLLVGEGAASHTYDLAFDLLMAICGAALVGFMAATLVADRAGTGRLVGGCALAALAPLALGSVVLTRFDLWPAALVAVALWALITRREGLAFGALGLAVAAKGYPLSLLPIFVAWVWKRSGRRRAANVLAISIAVIAACLLPFVALSAGGVWDSSLRQTSRPLQIETLGSGALLAAHHLFDLHLQVEWSHGSQNLGGALPDGIAIAQTLVGLAVLVGIWVWFARGPAERERLFRACAACVCAVVVFGKVLSPQFLVWLVPLVPLVRGRRGMAAGVLLAAALVLTQLWFPYRYWRLVFGLDTEASWLVLARDLVLVGLLVVLAWPSRTRAGDGPSRGGAAEASGN